MSIVLDGTSGITTPQVTTDDGEAYAPGNILGTVSQSSGVPTGAIIQRGSNANGEFVRYADGTQICYETNFNIDSTTSINNFFGSTSGTAFFSANTRTFPVAFTAAPAISCIQFGAASMYVRQTSTTATTVTLQAFNATSVVDRKFSYTAIGQWF